MSIKCELGEWYVTSKDRVLQFITPISENGRYNVFKNSTWDHIYFDKEWTFPETGEFIVRKHNGVNPDTTRENKIEAKKMRRQTRSKTIFSAYVLVGIITFGHSANYFLEPYTNYDNTNSDAHSEKFERVIDALVSSTLWPLYWSYKVFKYAPSISIEVKNVQR